MSQDNVLDAPRRERPEGRGESRQEGPPAAGAAPAAPLSLLSALLRALRPKQWIKNTVLLAGLVFTLNQGHSEADFLRVAAAFLVFCFLASAIYLVNDVCDLEQDRQHPKKRRRPLAAGQISVRTALVTAALLGLLGTAGALVLGGWFAVAAGIYLALTLCYSFWLKHEVLLDVIVLAGFYVIRAIAGALVISVTISPWLVVCTMLGALLLGLAKRRNEMVTLDDAGSHRKILVEYTVPMLDQLIGIVAACTLMAYMLYTFFSPTAQERPLLMLTIPFVVYGVFRFFYLIYRRNKGGNPSSDLIEDGRLIISGLLWALTATLVMLYGR